jgi:hypothetical protein
MEEFVINGSVLYSVHICRQQLLFIRGPIKWRPHFISHRRVEKRGKLYYPCRPMHSISGGHRYAMSLRRYKLPVTFCF